MLIVATLFVLTIPNVTKVIGLVDDKACKALTKVIDTAIVEYRLEYGEDPGNIMDLYNAGYISESQLKCTNGTEIRLSDGHAVYE